MVTRVVNEVNGSGSGHEVTSGSKNKDRRADDDTNEIVLKVKPERINVIVIHLRSLDYNDRH